MSLDSATAVEWFFDRITPYLEQGDKFILSNGSRGYTLTNAKLFQVKQYFTAMVHGDVRDESVPYGSDTEAIDVEFYSAFVLSSMPDRVGAKYDFAEGAYFPYTHDFDCEDLTAELANLGCWKELIPKNYNDNCILNAFRSAGVTEPVLNAMKTQLLRRTISRKSIHIIANWHNLYVTIRTPDKDTGHIKRYGNEKTGFPVELALYKGHYLHYYKTKFNSYAVEHYDELKIRGGKSWWTWKSCSKRSAKSEGKGMTSLNLLRAIVETPHIKKISIATEGIFKTQFYDKVSMTEFDTLEYPKEHSVLFHPKRNGRGPYTGEVTSEEDEEADSDIGKPEEEIDEEIENEDQTKMKERILRYRETIDKKDPSVLPRLDKKFREFKFGLTEQAKLLARSIPADAYVFFDFESTTVASHDTATTINRCARKIMNARDGEGVVERIETRVRQGNLDETTRASLYQEQCPHVGYMCCYSEFNETQVHETRGDDCAKAFLDAICEKYGRIKPTDMEDKRNWQPPVVKLLAHNITYDLSFLWPYLARIKTCEKANTSIVCGSAWYYRYGAERRLDPGARTPNWCPDKVVQFSFQDTYKMISMPLSDFGVSFKLDQEKEVMPFHMYTEEFVSAGGVATKEQLRQIPNFKDHLQLQHNLDTWGCRLADDTYDMIKYSAIYCRADVTVMKEGWRTFRDSWLAFDNTDCFSYPTISSLADAHTTEQGCFEGVHKIAGVPQRFISLPSVGGRVMCANNERVEMRASAQQAMSRQTKIMGTAKSIPYRPLADFDGVSLYPSAMARIDGFLLGAPKVWHEGVDLAKTDGFFVTIRVSKVGKKYRFPICRIKDDDGANRWTNELEGQILTVDMFTLWDLVRFSQVEYTVLRGYYFDGGRNPRIREVIEHLFQRRLEYKKVGNPMQLVLKLVMCAAIGICGLKPIDTEIRYVPEGTQYVNFVNTHCNRIKCMTRMTNNQWRFELYKEIDTHFNRQHLACEVLSVSKNIMNEVMCLAEDIDGACIHYTDTDSMHIDDEQVQPLAAAFRETYGKELIGTQLGQFHTDFDFAGSFRIVNEQLERVGDSMKSVGKIVAVESYLIEKKTYIDMIMDEAGQVCYHIRCKGLPAKCIVHKCNESYQGDPMRLYKDFYEGEGVSFDLASGGNCVFKANKNHTMSTGSLTREFRFPIKLDLAGFAP